MNEGRNPISDGIFEPVDSKRSRRSSDLDVFRDGTLIYVRGVCHEIEGVYGFGTRKYAALFFEADVQRAREIFRLSSPVVTAKSMSIEVYTSGTCAVIALPPTTTTSILCRFK